MVLFTDLNDQQQQIVQNSDGVVIVNAGPGTGKTKTLTTRVAFLIQNRVVDPKNILTLTFTNRASLEMKNRLGQMLGHNLPLITTFHGFAFELLTDLGQKIEIISEEDQESLLKKICQENGKKITARDLSLAISRSKNTTHNLKLAETVEQLITEYNQHLTNNNLLDFDDLLLRVWQLLKNNSHLREKLQKLYQYILIDEFQDTNDLQYQIIKLMLNNNPQLFVIGDPYQSIYAFRGVNSKIFHQLKADFPDVKEATLEINYRSQNKIVQISNHLFPNIKLSSFYQAGGKVCMVQTLNEYSEAEWIVAFISQKIGGTSLLSASGSEQATFDDFAIIYRTHHLANILKKKFDQSGMPFQVVKEDTFIEGDHIKLLSMHAAKGLEFKYVIICGFEEGLIPLIKVESSMEDLEEEKRLLYVALTRAKVELYLLFTKKRQGKISTISSFKKLLQHPDLLEIEDQATEKIFQKRQSLKIKKSQISLF